MFKKSPSKKSKNKNAARSKNNEFFLMLPLEVIFQILLFLRMKDMGAISLTSKFFNELAKDTYLRKMFLAQDIDYSQTPHKKSIVIENTTLDNDDKKIVAILPLGDDRMVVANANAIQILGKKIVKPHILAMHNKLSALIKISTEMFASSSHDGSLKIWNVQSGEHRAFMNDSAILCLIQLSDHTLITGDVNGKVKLWDIDSGQCTILMETAHRADESIVSLVKVSDDMIASGSDFGTVHIWDMKNNECIKTMELEDRVMINVMARISDNIVAAGYSNDRIIFWDIHNGKQTSKFKLDSSPWTIDKITDQEIGIGLYDGSLEIWDIPKQQKILVVKPEHVKTLTALSHFPDKNIYCGYYDGSIDVFSFPYKGFEKELSPPENTNDNAKESVKKQYT